MSGREQDLGILLGALRTLAKWALNPWVVLGGIGAGVLVGLWQPNLARNLAPVGDIYLALLSMCVLPLMMSALVSSVAKALSGGTGACYAGRMSRVFAGGLLMAAVLGVALGVLLQPGARLSEESKALLGTRVLVTEQATAPAAPPATEHRGLLGFLNSLVPANVFAAASNGSSLALVFFSLILGLGLGSLRNARSATAIEVIEAAYEALLRVIAWIMYGLPVGLACLVAAQVESSGTALALAMGWFVLAVYAGCLALVLVSLLLIRWRTGRANRDVLRAVKAPLLVAFGTSSSFAALPAILVAVSDKLGRARAGVNLVVPLGVNLHAQGSVLYFALAALFVAQLYGVNLGPGDYLLVILGAVFAALAASDVPGPAGIAMLAIVLDPLGLPVSVAVVLLGVIDPLVDPATTAADVQGNCAAAALVVGPESQDGTAEAAR